MCVLCSLSLHYTPFYRSACPSISLTLRKRNQIPLEKERPELVDGNWIPMFCFCQQSQNHRLDIPLKVQVGKQRKQQTGLWAEKMFKTLLAQVGAQYISKA